MIIEKIHWYFKLIYNKINSNDKRSFSDNEIDAFVNRGISEFTEMCYKGTNSKGFQIGFEMTQQRIDMLSTLVISANEQDPIEPFNVVDDVYEFKLSDLKYDYLHQIRLTAKIKDCDEWYTVSIEQSDDLSYVLRDDNRKPSIQWKRVVGQFRKTSDTIGASSLYLYTNGLFEIETLQVEYLKKPQEVCLGTYHDIPTLDNPTPALKPQAQCDLPEQWHELIVDIAVQEASRVLNDFNALQGRQDRINKMIN
jgi:hypothetical protein